LGWLFVIYLSATMLVNYDTDTTDISGAVFVALSVMAGLAFTYAGALLGNGRERADILYAGERLCQGAMTFLAASLLKHGTIVIPAQIAAVSTWVEGRVGIKGIELGPPILLLVLTLQIVLFFVFVSGLLVAQLGYQVLGRVVMQRVSRRQLPGGYFPPQE
jgi:hypothetical protein